MPNYCNYAMCVKGQAKNVKEFIKIIQQEDYRKGPHLYRVFGAEVLDMPDIISDTETITVDIVGYCAWSVSTCMMPGEFGYYQRAQNTSNGTTLVDESKRLALGIEVYSEEMGIGFEEHIKIQNGVVIVDDTLEDVVEYCAEDYDSVEALNAESGLNITQADFESEDSFKSGGYAEWAFSL